MENNEIIFNWGSILVNALITVVFSGLIGGYLSHYFNKKLERLKIKSNKDLQVESFFRDISGQKLEENFSEWTNLFFNMTSINEMEQKDLESKLNKMLTDVFLYGSRDTIKKAVSMQQYTYRMNQEQQQINSFVYMFLFASVICSLKKDFTGHQIEEKELIKMMIKDYESNVEGFEQAYKIFKSIDN